MDKPPLSARPRRNGWGRKARGVVVGDINLAGATETAERIVTAGGMATAVHFDLASQASIKALHERALEEMGGVDGLFDVGADLRACTDQPPDNPERDGDILEIDPVWRQSFKTNLFGYFHTVRAVLPAWSGKGMA